MKRPSFLLILFFTVMGVGGLPALAQSQSERYPTDAELQRAIEEFRRDIPILQRSRQFRQAPFVPALESFINAGRASRSSRSALYRYVGRSRV